MIPKVKFLKNLHHTSWAYIFWLNIMNFAGVRQTKLYHIIELPI
ncbi:Protein of unknown function, partial [Gryllus bimaculatus]